MCQGQVLLWGSTCVATVGAVWWGFKKFYKPTTTEPRTAAPCLHSLKSTEAPNHMGALAVPAERAVLPIHVDTTKLPSGVAIAPVLLYPPRHALVPFIVDESVSANGVTQVLLCCEDVTRLATGSPAQGATTATAASGPFYFPSANDATPDELVIAFQSYVDSACPFFHSASSKEGKTELRCMHLQALAEAFPTIAPSVSAMPLFTHVVAGQKYCALLTFLPEMSSVVTLVLVADVKGSLEHAAAILSNEGTWWPLVSSITANKLGTQECATRGFGKGRVRATGRFAKPAKLLTATIEGCPHVSGIMTALSTGDGGGPVLSVIDTVDASIHTVTLEEPSSNATKNESQPPAAAGPHDGSTASTSSRLEASLLEAWDVVGEGHHQSKDGGHTAPLPMSCLLQYTNDVLGISLQCAPGCSLDEVRFATRPCVHYMPQPPQPNDIRPRPLLTIERVSVLPDGWTQASASFSADDFLELLQHNIIFNLTPWESHGKRPELVETDICGLRAWMLHEEMEGQRCRTYVCPHLAALPSTGASTATAKGQSAAALPLRASLVKALLLIRWEAPVEEWDAQLPILRRLLDTLHVDFGA